MSFKYAQLGADNAVISVSYLAEEVQRDDMILLEESDDVQPLDVYNGDGSWTRPDPIVEPEPGIPTSERIAHLEFAIVALMDTIATLQQGGE